MSVLVTVMLLGTLIATTSGSPVLTVPWTPDVFRYLVIEAKSSGRYVRLAGHRLDFVDPDPTLGEFWITLGQDPNTPETGNRNLLGLSYSGQTALIPGTIAVGGGRVADVNALHAGAQLAWKSKYYIAGGPGLDPGDQDWNYRLQSVPIGYTGTVGQSIPYGYFSLTHDWSAPTGGIKELMRVWSNGTNDAVVTPPADGFGSLGGRGPDGQFYAWRALWAMQGRFGTSAVPSGPVTVLARQPSNGSKALTVQRWSDMGASGRLLSAINAADTAELFAVDAAEPSGVQTTMIVRYANGVTVQSQFVSVSAPNSCGLGFRCLMVPN